MAKGKYATRALNRAASIDNDVIVELREEVSALRTQLNVVNSQLSAERSRHSAEVMRAASDVANAEVSRVRDELERAKRLHADALYDIAIAYLTHTRKSGRIDAEYGLGLIERCVPGAKERSRLYNNWIEGGDL